MLLRLPQRAFSAAAAAAAPAYGFIGLGQMGRHMAMNLARKTKAPFFIYDVQENAMDDFVARAPSESPVTPCESPMSVAMQSNIIITMLPSSPHVRSVYLDPSNGLINGLRKDAIVIDSSTIDPATSQDVQEKLMTTAGHNLNAVVDAPVSGGVLGAEAGTLTFMVGGDEKSFATVKPILEHMGKNIVHCGGSGMGQVAKICNNMLLGISMFATSETLNLGIRLGMDPKILSQIIATSSGRNWSLDTYNPVPGILPNVPASRNYAGGFNINLMAKDMGLAVQAALDSNSTCIMGALAKDLYRNIATSALETAKGETEHLGQKDFSVVFKWLDDNSKKF